VSLPKYKTLKVYSPLTTNYGSQLRKGKNPANLFNPVNPNSDNFPATKALRHKALRGKLTSIKQKNNCLRHAMEETSARHCEGFPEAIQYFKKAAQSVGQSAISGLLRLRLAMTERVKS
jgi:hypothetical protein